jgi:NAD-dependent dihydropyrimidine dehydrogenase PreA subunit
MEDLKYLHAVSTLKIDTGRCTGCGMCIEVCPHDVFRIDRKKAVIHDLDACMECGACAKICPSDAIFIKPGVGCAAAIVSGWIHRKEPSCGCSDNKGCC